MYQIIFLLDFETVMTYGMFCFYFINNLWLKSDILNIPI